MSEKKSPSEAQNHDAYRAFLAYQLGFSGAYLPLMAASF